MAAPVVLVPQVQRTPAMSLDAFVRQTRTTISDVVLSASADMHRVELAQTGRPRFTVTVPCGADDGDAAGAEAAVLAQLHRTLTPTLARTVPICVDVVEVSARRCLVLTALVGEALQPVPVPPSLIWDGTIEEHFRPVLQWLRELWTCTCTSAAAPVDTTLVCRLAERLAHDPRWPRTEALVVAAADRLAGDPVRGTAVHGGFSPQAVRLGPGGVTGVGDWSRARMSGDGRADVARFVVGYAPDHVSIALHARTRYAATVRGFVRGALSHLGADPDSWREVLVVGLAEAAAAADPALAGEATRELWSLSTASSWTGSPRRGVTET